MQTNLWNKEKKFWVMITEIKTWWNLMMKRIMKPRMKKIIQNNKMLYECKSKVIHSLGIFSYKSYKIKSSLIVNLKMISLKRQWGEQKKIPFTILVGYIWKKGTRSLHAESCSLLNTCVFGELNTMLCVLLAFELNSNLIHNFSQELSQ